MNSLGKIVKVRGNRGEVVITSSPLRKFSIPKKGETVLITSSRYKKSVNVEYCKKIGGAFVLKFLDVNSINDALKLVGYDISALSNSKDQKNNRDIVGYTVRDIDNRSWGEIINVATFNLNQILEIRDKDDIIYVPFEHSIIKEINEEKKLVIIDPPDGLRDLNK